MKNVTVEMIAIDKIDVKTNPREIKKKDVKELAASIKRVGVTVPIAVRIMGQSGGYTLVCGGRRTEASKQAGLTEIPALVYPIDTPESEIVNITHFENAFRKELKPMDEARSVKKIYDECGSYKDTATILGITAQKVACCVNILTGLSKSWTKEFKKRDSDYKPTLAHMEILARFSDEVQERLYEYFDDDNFNDMDDFKRACEKEQQCLSEATWDVDVYCIECVKRTDIQKDLFGAIKKGKLGECLDKECWKKQGSDHIERLLTESREKNGEVKYGYDGYLGYYEEKDMREKYGNCISLSSTETSKKVDGFPLFIVAGKQVGKTMWRKFPKKADGSTTETTAGTGVKTLSERRDGLNRKRWSFVNATLVKLLSGDWDVSQLKYADKVTAVMYLVSCFGVKTFASNKIEDIEKTLTAKEVQAAMTDKLFEMVSGTFLYDLEWTGAITQIPDSMIKMTKLVADVFQIELKPYEEEAKRTYKEPKSWANLKADGTPK